MPPSPPLDEVDRIFGRWFDRGRAPGVAWGVVADGRLVHAGGLGTARIGEDARPAADTVFRIASMTKSFVAAAVLLLRDEGRLRLDDPVEEHVPELRGLPRATIDSPAITLRELLAMRSGYPEDDPWADRLEAMDEQAYTALMAGPKTRARAPGVAFDYSNVGFTLLGRVIANATGRPYRDVIDEQLLRPLGLADTTWSGVGASRARLALGYARVDDAWEEQPVQEPGAFSALGGLHSTVADLAVWVAWLADAFPPRDDPDPGPLARSSRRELQQVVTTMPLQVGERGLGALRAHADGYCLGLMSRDDLATGRTVGHSGGYPGYGSHMRWHPATGLGVVALANGRYAGPSEPALEALELLVARAPSRQEVEPHPALAALRPVIDAALAAGDAAALEPLYAGNVGLDEALARRAARVAALPERHGSLHPDPALVALTPTQARWRLDGERGSVEVEAMLSPDDPPLLQRLEVEGVLPPSDRLARTAEAAVAELRTGDLAPALGDAPTWRWVASDGERIGAVLVGGAHLDVRLEVDLDADPVVRVVPAERYPAPW